MVIDMDGKFITLTGFVAVAAFSGVWIATAPAASVPQRIVASPAPAPTPKARTSRAIFGEAPPEDTQPVSAFAQETARPGRTTAKGGSDIYFYNCNAARAAGAAPLYAGEPGYRIEMDGDGDGIACEPHRGRY